MSKKSLQLEGKFFVFFEHFHPFSKRINSVERQFFCCLSTVRSVAKTATSETLTFGRLIQIIPLETSHPWSTQPTNQWNPRIAAWVTTACVKTHPAGAATPPHQKKWRVADFFENGFWTLGGKIHVSHDKKGHWLVSVYQGIILSSNMGIIINYYKDPYWPTSIMESRRFFFVARVFPGFPPKKILRINKEIISWDLTNCWWFRNPAITSGGW